MKEIFPPLCFLLAIALLIIGFTVSSVDPPAASMELHQARATGDEQATETLEADLKQRQLSRQVAIIGSLSGSVLMVVLGFKLMRVR